MPKPDEKTRRKLERIGVRDLEGPGDEDVRRVIAATLTGTLAPEVASSFLRQAAVAPKICLEALRTAMSEGSKVSAKTVDAISRSIPLLESALASASSAQEREQIREQVILLVREARGEARETREFLLKMGGAAAGVAILSIGAIVFVASQGRNRELLQAGGKLLRGA
jgi:hypothetical protein